MESKLSFLRLHSFASSVPKLLTANKALIESAEYLSNQIPIRASKKLMQLSDFPKTWPAIGLLSKRYEALARGPFPGNQKPLDTSAALIVGTWLENNMNLLEQDVTELQSSLREAIQVGNIPLNHPSIAPLMDATLAHLISNTLLLSQHRNFTKLVSKSPEEISDATYAALPVISADCNLLALAEDVAHEARSNCIKKFGDAPDVVIAAGRGMEVDPSPRSSGAPSSLVVRGHVQFVLAELLRNAFIAAAAFWGRRLQSAPPIQITLSKSEAEIGIRVSDRAGGIAPQHRDKVFTYFYTSAAPAVHNSAHAARGVHPTKGPAMHGAKWSGPGVGLALARLHCRIAGGDLALQCLPGHGTDAYVTLARFGADAVPEY